MLILVSLVVIFISVIFIMFTITEISNKYMKCFKGQDNKTVCSFTGFGGSFVFGLVIIGVFVLIDVFVIYFLFTALTSKQSLAYYAGGT